MVVGFDGRELERTDPQHDEQYRKFDEHGNFPDESLKNTNDPPEHPAGHSLAETD
jgi:hypothetical protein